MHRLSECRSRPLPWQAPSDGAWLLSAVRGAPRTPPSPSGATRRCARTGRCGHWPALRPRPNAAMVRELCSPDPVKGGSRSPGCVLPWPGCRGRRTVGWCRPSGPRPTRSSATPRPRNFAEAIAFVARERASLVTGQMTVVDGGPLAVSTTLRPPLLARRGGHPGRPRLPRSGRGRRGRKVPTAEELGTAGRDVGRRLSNGRGGHPRGGRSAHRSGGVRWHPAVAVTGYPAALDRCPEVRASGHPNVQMSRGTMWHEWCGLPWPRGDRTCRGYSVASWVPASAACRSRHARGVRPLMRWERE